MAKSKNKYDYAEYDLIRVIIVSIAGTARLAEQRRVAAPRRGTRRTETAAPRPVSCTRACGGDQRRARGGSRGRVGCVTSVELIATGVGWRGTAQKGALRGERPRHGCVGRGTTGRAAISATTDVRGRAKTRPPGTARCAADRHGAAGHGYARRKGGGTRLLTSPGQFQYDSLREDSAF